jgi:ethanolamine utilization microcompartment shell protein EutL
VHRDNEKRFVARVDEKLIEFLELESAIRACGQLSRQAGEISPKLPEYENSPFYKF